MEDTNELDYNKIIYKKIIEIIFIKINVKKKFKNNIIN